MKVLKVELLAKVSANRERHRQTFEDAQEVYREEVIQELDRMLADARQGRKVRTSVQLIAPEDHTEDYDRVIAMLGMEVEDTVELDSTQFENFVLDRWRWSQGFAANTASYAAKKVR